MQTADTTPAADPFADMDEIITEADWVAGQDAPEDEAAPLTFREVCKKCRGSGTYYGRSRFGQRCFACKGAGGWDRKTSPEARARAAAGREAAKVRKGDAALAAFAVEHPEAAAWVADRAPSFGFALSMQEAVRKWGHLTPGQLAAVDRMIVGDRERAERKAAEAVERAAAVEAAPAVTVSKIEDAFASAKAHGIEFPKLRLAGFKFSPAPAHGANAGAIYVKEVETGEYLGKIAGGKFLKVRTCEEVTAAEVVEVASNPAASATAYGQRTGKCSCCGRKLTKGESIDRAIGPICAEKYGW